MLAACASGGLPFDGKISSLVVFRPKAKDGKPGRSVVVWDLRCRSMTFVARESRRVRATGMPAVQAPDEFAVEFPTEPKISYRPHVASDCGPVIAAYSVAETKSSPHMTELLGNQNLEQVKSASTGTSSISRCEVRERAPLSFPTDSLIPGRSRKFSMNSIRRAAAPRTDLCPAAPRSKYSWKPRESRVRLPAQSYGSLRTADAGSGSAIRLV